MNETQKNILVVEDEPVFRKLLEHRLTSAGFNVYAPEFQAGASDINDVIGFAKDYSIHIAILDLTLPGQGNHSSVTMGLSLIKEIKALRNGIFIFICSGSVTGDALPKLKGLGAVKCFSKDNQQCIDEIMDAVAEYAQKPLRITQADV